METSNFEKINFFWKKFLLTEGEENKIFTEKIILLLVKEGMVVFRTDHPELDRFLNDMNSAGMRWGIVGGSIRDFIFGYKPKDIDILVDASDEDLDSLLKEKNYNIHSRNVFNGREMLFDGQITDLWTLDSTWGIKAGYKKNKGFKSWPKVATFSADAAIVAPDYDEIYAEHLAKTLQTGKVEVIFDKTPIPLLTAIKAFRLFQKYNLRPGKSAVKFIGKIAKKLKKYPDSKFELRH